MENPLSSEEIRDFWHPIPGLHDGLNNKKGPARFVYLTLLHYFYYNHQFPDFNPLPEELLLYGLEHTASFVTIDQISELFNNERQLCRYKDEIRSNLGYRLFEQKDHAILKENFSVLFSGNANKDALKELLLKEFDKQKIERLNAVDTQNIINKIQYEEEQATFSQIDSLLTKKGKAYIDDYILSSNDFVYYGKGGEISSNCRDDQEISMLCLHLLQTCISYVNTFLVEDLLQNAHWKNQLGEEDYRALTALFYQHINPYGTFDLDLTKRLLFTLTPTDK